jgi:fibronectin type 3 domain-containing protein
LTFYQSGDLYRASEDLDRMVVTDNQLETLGRIIGDGVLQGWNITSLGGLSIRVSLGTGFIKKIYHSTLSLKNATVFNNATTLVYMRSNMIGSSGGLVQNAESPLSNLASATFVDVTPPTSPTNFAANATSFDVINLTWDANTETDFDHYTLYRATNILGPYSLIASPTTNGIAPDDPYQDTDLTGGTTYYYQIYAVDKSGNVSAAAAISDTTLPDTTIPAEITNLQVFPGNGQIAAFWAPSVSSNVVGYVVIVDRLNPNGTVAVTLPSISVGLNEFVQVTGLVNSSRHRITVKARNTSTGTDPLGNLNNGISAETVPTTSAAPLDVTSLSATPLVTSIKLDWTPSVSPSGGAVGQKAAYIIRVLNDVQSTPINVGLVNSKTLNGYSAGGDTIFFEDDVPYAFLVTTQDAFGNESGGVVVKGTTQDLTVPNNPRFFNAIAGDQMATLSWRHSSSQDVAGYNIAFDNGSGFGADIVLGYVESHVLSGLTNNLITTIRVRSRDDVGNLSSGILVVVTPVIDTVPPAVPGFLAVTAGDQHAKATWAEVADVDVDHYVVKRQHIAEPLNSPPNAAKTVLSETLLNVGLSTNVVDIGLMNDEVYRYFVQAVDARGNVGDFSSPIIVSPSENLNTGTSRLVAPTGLIATFSLGTINLVWSFVPPTTDPATNFNIYRSTQPTSSFSLIDSVGSGTTTYADTDLVNGTTYYYMVTAVRDGGVVVVDTGSIQPANTILLGTVAAQAGSITSVSNEQRLVENLNATLTEETTARLLTHKHATKPLNLTTIDAVRTLALMDAADLADVNLEELTALSPTTMAYYEGLLVDPRTGEEFKYDNNTTFIINPSANIWNVPFVGDFQLLINGQKPSVEFQIDEDRNAIVFPAALKDADLPSLDGLGLTFYVPSKIDSKYVGFDIFINGVSSPVADMDEELQTVKFNPPLADADAVTLEIEPSVPDFGTQDGARQVSLSPDAVLNDFSATNQTTWVSTSGAFTSDDVVFALVDGVRTSLDYFVDFNAKSIVFAEPLPLGQSVALEVLGREEVTNELPAERLVGLDGSQFKSGEFLKEQLPDISHEGRIKELALPVFTSIASANNYTYPTEQGVLGAATTPYAILQILKGLRIHYLMGTSRGLLKTVRGVFLTSGDDAVIDEEIVGFQIEPEDPPVDSADGAVPYSGRIQGAITTGSVVLQNPVAIELTDGRVLFCGGLQDTGEASAAAYLYDPVGDAWEQVSSMLDKRMEHAAIRLPNGKVLVSGGQYRYEGSGGQFDGLAVNIRNCEIFDPATETWASTGQMIEGRFLHSLAMVDDTATSDVLVAGGAAVIGQEATSTSPSGTTYRIATGDLQSSELYSQTTTLWTSTDSLEKPARNAQVSTNGGKIILDTSSVRQIYSPSTGTWDTSAPVLVSSVEDATKSQQIDGPAKQIMQDSTGAILVVTRNNVYISRDGGSNFSAMKGFEAVGVVHKIAEANNGTLFAATDLGVYEITTDIRANDTWFQGGLIGAGTTETFDLQAVSTYMLAATEIGIFLTADDGTTWTSTLTADDVFNIELFQDLILFAQAGQDLYKSTNGGMTWTLMATLTFFDPNSKMLARPPHLFAATGQGLFYSLDGVVFQVVNFDLNRNQNKNNVHMAETIGGDLFVGYDNLVLAIGPDLGQTIVAEFTGAVPTVRVNEEEARNGFRYDQTNNFVVFEIKRLVDDQVDVTANYSLYEMTGGDWYSQNPSSPVQVFVNGAIFDAGITTDPRLGRIFFDEPNLKTDVVTVSIIGTSLKNAGQYFHEELEDKLALEKGLPFSLGRNYEGNLLQMGLSIEHNFLERGLERNQYYCLTGSLVDRSFTAFLLNSNFFILGRKEYDVFNSTIDYREESKQPLLGPRALVPLSSLEYSATEIWIGTDSGIFVLDQISFDVSETIDLDGNPVRDMQFFFGDVYAATKAGVYKLSDSGSGLVVEKTPGKNLPNNVFAVNSVGNILVAGTDDAIYYSDASDSPPYEVWSRSSFTVVNETAELPVSGTCTFMLVRDGTAFASINDAIFSSTDGKLWRQVFKFPDPAPGEEPVVITRMASFAERLFLGTNQGVYNDDGSARSDIVNFRLELAAGTEEDSKALHVNDLFAAEDALYLATNASSVYVLQNETWSTTATPASSVHEFLVTNGGRKIALSNNSVYVD